MEHRHLERHGMQMKKTILLFRKYRNALRLHILLPADAQNTIISGENGMQCVAELKKQNEAASKGMAEAFTTVMTFPENFGNPEYYQRDIFPDRAACPKRIH